MFGDDSRAAGRTNESMQYKQPTVRVSKTFQDSNIFGAKDATSSTITQDASRNTQTHHYIPPRVSKTYQDSNIFGYKDASSETVTDNAKREMQRPFTAHKKVISRPTEINEVFVRDDKNARQRLRKTNDRAFAPNYERSSPTKRHVNEFYGEHHASGYDGALLRPQTATSKSFTVGPKKASDVKWEHQQSNIFSDDTKANIVRMTPDGDRLMSSTSKWDSKDAFKRSSNLRKSEDLTSTSMKAFAQTKKQREMTSDIFNTGPKQNQRASIDVNARPQETAKASFTDTKNQDLRRSQHMFSDLFNHDDKNYTYKGSPNNQTEPIRPTNLAWNDSRVQKLSPRKYEEQSANERKMAHLSSSAQSAMNMTDYKSPKVQDAPKLTDKALEKEMKLNMSPQEKRAHEMRSEVPFGQSSQNWATTKPEPSATYDFDINSIPKDMDLDTLKKKFAGYHVIDLQADRNNVAGTATGTGRIQLRASASHDLLKLKHDLKQQGISLNAHEEKHNLKKSNYRDMAKMNWHDQYLQHEEGRLKSDFTSPLESKLKNLESEGDIFGNTQGVGKWDRSTIEKVPSSKTDNQGIQKAASDVVKTLNWKNSIKKVATTAKAGAAAAEKEKPKAARPSTTKSTTAVQPKKAK